MKIKKLLFILATAFLLTSCNVSHSTVNPDSGSSSGSSSTSGGSTSGGGESTPIKPKKITVAAHTLKDSNPPINVNALGQKVNETTWESFRNASSSKFNGNYNYTYNAYAGGFQTIEAFTKNGYYMQSIGGKLYYERKNGSTFYAYSSTNEGYLRSETTLDIQSKYTYRIQQEIYVHMFDFSNYEYDSFDGCYRYYAQGFTAAAKFQGGYLTYLYYIMGMNFFEIKASFETTIDIPASYYYE